MNSRDIEKELYSLIENFLMEEGKQYVSIKVYAEKDSDGNGFSTSVDLDWD